MRTLILLPLVLLSLSACSIRFGGRPSSEPPPPPPQQRQDPMHSQPGYGGEVVRAKQIKARVVRARVIYAKEVKARDGSVGRIYTGEHRGQHGKGELKLDTVQADVIYAKEIKADWIEAEEIYAREVKIGR